MTSDNQTWNHRYREYMDKIKTGSAYEIAEVLRDLYLLRKHKDLSFGELNPEARNSIVTHFARLDMVGGDRVGRIADQIKRRLAEHGMEAWVYGRGKRPFSIWRKLQTKKLSFEQLSDIVGFRVIAGSTAD